MDNLAPKAIRIVDLDKDTTRRELKILLKDRLYLQGEIGQIYVRNDFQLGLVFAYVTFELSDDARRAVQTFDGFEYKSLKLDVAVISPDSVYKKYTTPTEIKAYNSAKKLKPKFISNYSAHSAQRNRNYSNKNEGSSKLETNRIKQRDAGKKADSTGNQSNKELVKSQNRKGSGLERIDFASTHSKPIPIANGRNTIELTNILKRWKLDDKKRSGSASALKLISKKSTTNEKSVPAEKREDNRNIASGYIGNISKKSVKSENGIDIESRKTTLTRNSKTVQINERSNNTGFWLWLKRQKKKVNGSASALETTSKKSSTNQKLRQWRK